jgi:Mg-chelatase subunit ChlD
MHEALTLAGVAVAVVTFNDWVSLAVPFGTPSAKARTLLSRLHVYAGTSDAVALRYAHEILLRRTEARRVCMVLTDGRGQIDGIKRQIASGENLGLSTLGVGIQADISDVYPQSVNVWELDDLGRAALSQMKVAA